MQILRQDDFSHNFITSRAVSEFHPATASIKMNGYILTLNEAGSNGHSQHPTPLYSWCYLGKEFTNAMDGHRRQLAWDGSPRIDTTMEPLTQTAALAQELAGK